MCDNRGSDNKHTMINKTVPVTEAVGMVLSHDITEIRRGEFKGRAFKKGHVIRKEDICHLQRLGKENLFILEIKQDEMHENDAAYAIAEALAGSGVKSNSEPKEGKINLAAERDGLLKIDREALLAFNTLGDVMCATIHSNSVVKKGQVVAGTRAIPLVVKKSIVDDAVTIAERGKGIVSVKPMRRPKAGIVITGNEVYYGRVTDAFKPLITMKIREYCGEVVGVYFAPDDAHYIEDRIRELISGGADLIITTGGMSVDPDDVTRFAIRNIGAQDITYGSPVLPGAMFLIAYVRAEEQKSRREEEKNSLTSKLSDFRTSGLIPILGIPACGMYCSTTIFDIVLPRILAGEKIDRKELAELGHGGLCLKCKECRYPVCPFGK